MAFDQPWYSWRVQADSIGGLLDGITKDTPFTWRKIAETYVILPKMDMGGTKQLYSERRKVFQVILPEEGIALETVQKEYIRQALERTDHNMTKAAKLLQVSYDTLRYHTKKYDLIK